MKLLSTIKVDEISPNGIIYPRNVLKKAIKEYNGRELKLGCLGNNINSSIEKVSHKVEKLYINEDNQIIGEIEILKTHIGDILKQLINAKVTLSLDINGYTNISNNIVSNFIIKSVNIT